MKNKLVELGPPSLGQAEKDALVSVIDSGWITMGDRVRQFETAFGAMHHKDHAVAVSSALLLCYSIGAIFGPILASFIMTLLNTPYGLYIYWSLIAGVFAAITIYFKQQEKITIIQPSDQVNFMPMKNTSSVAMMMDPRTDADR